MLFSFINIHEENNKVKKSNLVPKKGNSVKITVTFLLHFVILILHCSPLIFFMYITMRLKGAFHIYYQLIRFICSKFSEKFQAHYLMRRRYRVKTDAYKKLRLFKLELI